MNRFFRFFKRQLVRNVIIAGGLILAIAGAAGSMALAAETSGSADSQSAYLAYLEILQQYQAQIEAYNWQTNLYNNGYIDNSAAESQSRHVAFTDLDGDNVPEMIFIAAMNADMTTDEYTQYSSTAFVFTFSDGAAQKVFTLENMDVQAGGGSYYCLFQTAGTNDLYVFYSTGDENWTYDFTRYTLQEGQMYQAGVLREEMNYSWQGNADNYDPVYSYSENDTQISRDEYLSRKTALCGSLTNLIMFNYIEDDDDIFRNAVRAQTPSAMTCADAITYAQAQAGRSSGSDASEETDAQPAGFAQALGGQSRNFVFSSGVGAWGTELVLNTDGTFSGEYHDSEMGDNRAPGGVRYVSSFTGTFTDLQKVDEYTYSMQLGDVSLQNAVGETWMDGEVLQIASDPYGLDDGGQFLLYLPGHPVSDLPEGFHSWADMALHGYASDGTYDGNYHDTLPAALPFYGLYNVNAQEGFVTYDEEVSTGESSSAVSMVTSSGQAVTVDGTTDGFLFPNSDSELLADTDISSFDSDQIQQAINEIYARHGYIFKDSTILAFYKQFSWYSPTVSDANAVYGAMNSTEKENVSFLSGRM